MKNKYKPYTNKELKLIAKLKREGKTNQFIADYTERTLGGVKRAVVDFKLNDKELWG